jgi:hypothetical protein
MSNGGNFQLCQNVSSIEIEKTYIFTFDMVCDYRHQNCSMWVIINNRIVNGSYRISYDTLPHNIVGYFNSTLSNNKICFESSEAPSVQC